MSLRRATAKGGASRLAAAGVVLLVLASAALWRLFSSDAPSLAPRDATAGAGDASAPTEGDPAPVDVAARRETTNDGKPPWSELDDPDDLGGQDGEEAAGEEGQRPVTLHVVDAESGGELRDVELAYASAGVITRSRASAESKTPGRPFRSGDSPLKLEPADDELDVALLMVSARGYEPGSLYLHWPSGGERRVALKRAGVLNVFVKDRPRDAAVQLALFDLEQDVARRRALADLSSRRAPADPAFEAELFGLMKEWGPRRVVELPQDGVARIAGLAPGSWGVRVAAKADREAGAAATVVLAAAAEADVELRWHAIAPIESARVTGLVRVPAEWGGPEPDASDGEWVRITRPGDPRSSRHAALVRHPSATAAAGSGEVWTFTEERLTPGRWIAQFFRWNFAAAFDVPARGAAEIGFDVPPPAELVVTVVDDPTGAEIADARAHCIVGPSDDFDFEFEASVVRGPPLRPVDGEREMEWRVPQGPLLVRAESGSKRWFGSESFVLGPGRTERTLRLRRPARVRLAVVDAAGVVIPWEDEFEPILEQGGRRATIFDADAPSLDPAVDLLVGGDGRFFLHVENVSGSKTTDAVPVDLRPGEETSVTVHLR